MTTILLHSDTEVLRTGAQIRRLASLRVIRWLLYATRALEPLERDSVWNSGELPKT
jgi:hypothetical protein